MITGLVLFPYVAAEQAAFPALGVSEQVRPEAQGERLPMPLEQVTSQGNTVSIPTGNSALAAIDTGTTLIAGPKTAVENVYSEIEGAQAEDGQLQGFFSFRKCSCSKFI